MIDSGENANLHVSRETHVAAAQGATETGASPMTLGAVHEIETKQAAAMGKTATMGDNDNGGAGCNSQTGPSSAISGAALGTSTHSPGASDEAMADLGESGAHRETELEAAKSSKSKAMSPAARRRKQEKQNERRQLQATKALNN